MNDVIRSRGIHLRMRSRASWIKSYVVTDCRCSASRA